MHKIIRPSFIFSILLLLPLLAKAELVQGEVYGGASMGVPVYDKLNKTDVGYKIYGGYLLYDFLGLDIGYVNLGNPDSGNGSLEVTGANVAAMGNFSLNNQISLFGKVGTFVWHSKRSGNGGNDNGNNISVGVGGDFNAKDNVFIHGEIERYEISNESIIMYSLGLLLAF